MLIKKSVVTAGIAIAALSVSAVAAASNNSGDFSNGSNAAFVVGIQGGYADEHWDNLFNNPQDSTKDTGFAGRAFIGYTANQYFGIESGYTYLPKTTFTTLTPGDSDIKDYAIDILGKLSVPVSNVFNVYAKAGGAYLNSKIDFAGQASQTNSHFGPAFGVGAAYEVVPNLAIDVSWMRFSGNGKFGADYQPNPDVALLGISYSFPVMYS